MNRLLLALCLVSVLLAQSLATMPVAHAQRVLPIGIESEPAGAVVYLDSTDAPPVGTTPIARVNVARGPHVLIFRLPNYQEGRLQIAVQRRREIFRAVLSALSVISVSATNSSAEGASIRVDGERVGAVPFRMTVAPGRHQIEITREGYNPLSQWVELGGGQVLALPVSLDRQAPQSGSVLVAGDISAADVFLDGQHRGVTPTVVEDVAVGEHIVEIRPPNLPAYTQRITVVVGQRTSVNPTLRAAGPATGSLRILANAPEAVVRVDGEQIGPAPATRENLAVGDHIVEVTAAGFQPAQQTVVVEAGRQRVVSIQLSPTAAASGRIVVNTATRGAVVFVDGEERGTPPVVIENAPAGTHAIVVSADGYDDYRATCQTGPSRNCELTATLEGRGTTIRVASAAPGAQIFIDGRPLGPVPYEGTLPIGQHRLELRARGYQTHVETIQLVASSAPRTFDIALRRQGELTAIEEAEHRADRDRRVGGAVSHSAEPLPTDFALLDISAGWPYFGELRFGVGIFDFLDAGFAVRSFGRITEFEGRVKLGYTMARYFSLAAVARGGGGLGLGREVAGEKHATNTWFGATEAMMSLSFAGNGAFTLYGGLDFYTDRWDFEATDSDRVLILNADRQVQSRVRFGGSLEIVMGRNWNLWALFEGVVVAPEESRRLYGDLLGLGDEDLERYARIGLTRKF